MKEHGFSAWLPPICGDTASIVQKEKVLSNQAVVNSPLLYIMVVLGKKYFNIW
jgi:hypothetical protein